MVQLNLLDVFADLIDPPKPAKKHDLVMCMGCRRFVLQRPGLCYSCSRDHGFDPNSVVVGPGKVTEQDDPAAREERIRLYEQRAKLRVPLFTAPVQTGSK